MRGLLIVARLALRESLRRKVFAVVLVLSVGFLGLYAWGAAELFEDVSGFGGNEAGVDADTLAGATILGLAMFATLFLGTILAVFLTLGAVRGDAERGLLQPLIVRPVGRTAYLGGRFAAAAAVSAGYVLVLFGLCALVTGLVGWWPDRFLVPALTLAGAVVVVAAISLLGSVLLSTTANGIGVLMVFGAGLTTGLLGQIGAALDSDTLNTIADVGAWLLPFEALYQDGLQQLTADTTGTTAAIVQLGPFGGSREGGPLLWPWTFVYLLGVGAVTAALFDRRDL